MARTKLGHGGKRKYGRNLDKCKVYRSEDRRFKNKIRRITRCNGLTAATAYRTEHYAL